MKPRFLLTMALAVAMLASCRKDDPVPPSGAAAVGIRFVHLVDSVPLALDTFSYTTRGGVLFKITDLQYFISGLTLYPAGGNPDILTDGDSIHYVDLRIPGTWLWHPAGSIPTGAFDSVAFTFGLAQWQNISNRFPNPPERDMFWPELLGGGYHHMKLNTVWKSCCTNLDSPFMMHLGTGQIYSSPTPNPDSITGFVQNAFRVVLPASSFTAAPGDTVILDIVMNIDHWFNGPPNMLDLNVMPQGIMQSQEWMGKICDNGKSAFSLQTELK